MHEGRDTPFWVAASPPILFALPDTHAVDTSPQPPLDIIMHTQRLRYGESAGG